MKVIYWAWMAVLADLAVFANPMPMENSTRAFIAVWAGHAAACTVLANATYLLLPLRYKNPRALVWLLMFDFAFIAPVIGPLGMLFIAHTTLYRESRSALRAAPVIVDLPEYNVQSKENTRSSQGAIRVRLSSNVPQGVRMQALLTLQSVPNRVSNPILENLLGDATDDVRLIAFGMLDAEEKKISVHIHRERKNLEGNLSPSQRYSCLRHLAELHWELIYASLVHGELREHILGEARQYIEAALALADKPDPGIDYLKGRILLAQGELAAAEESLVNAVKLGQPEASALPYLAEMAFKRREFDSVRNFMQRLQGLQVTARTQAIVDLWSGRDSVANFRDRRILAHI